MTSDSSKGDIHIELDTNHLTYVISIKNTGCVDYFNGIGFTDTVKHPISSNIIIKISIRTDIHISSNSDDTTRGNIREIFLKIQTDIKIIIR